MSKPRRFAAAFRTLYYLLQRRNAEGVVPTIQPPGGREFRIKLTIKCELTHSQNIILRKAYGDFPNR